MSLYQQPSQKPAIAPLMDAPAARDEGDHGNPFPPAWVKTQDDYENWLEAEVQWTLDHPGRRIPFDDALAILKKHRQDFLREKERRHVASA